MATKRRAPIEQLRAAGSIARELLIARGLREEESAIDKIVADSKAPTLPGIPSYLPHEWTLKATQQIMRDVVILWKDHIQTNGGDLEDITKFWLFTREQLRQQEEAFAKEETAMPKILASMKTVPVLKDIFSPVRKKENVQAIQRFLVDSFAVAIVVKKQHSTSEYLHWFLDWTQDLLILWVRPDKRKKVKRV